MIRRAHRRLIGGVVSLWLAGWVPSMVYTWRVGGGPQFYAVWIILGPLATASGVVGVCALWLFYEWALGGPSPEQIQKRIADLERDLGIAAPSISYQPPPVEIHRNPYTLERTHG